LCGDHEEVSVMNILATPVEIYGSIILADGRRSLPRLICTVTAVDDKAGAWIPVVPLSFGEAHEAVLPRPGCPDECPIRKR